MSEVLVLRVEVPGKPRGQGSGDPIWDPRQKRGVFKYAGDMVRHRNMTIDLLRKAWAGRPALEGPVGVAITARLARPKNHFGTGRNAHKLKDWAPEYAITYPDSDKIARLVDDALTYAGVLVDDVLVVMLSVEKEYTEGMPCTVIEVYTLGKEEG